MKTLSIGLLVLAVVAASGLTWNGMVPGRLDSSDLTVTGGCTNNCRTGEVIDCREQAGENCNTGMVMNCFRDDSGSGVCVYIEPSCLDPGCVPQENWGCLK